MAITDVSGPTPQAEVNLLLRAMLPELRLILGERFVGMYLYGSLALGDFDPASSDVDFLVATDGSLPAETIERLRGMHAAIAASGLPYATHLEGSYLPKTALRRYDPADAWHPTIGSDWPFQIGYHDDAWVIQLYTIREHGVVVWGSVPQRLIDPISSEELQEAVRNQIENVWRVRAEDAAWLSTAHYQGFTILTICRTLYTLRTGALCSKPQAAAWAQAQYPQWQAIIGQALLWRTEDGPGDLAATQAFLREALKECSEVAGA